jgi:hypothetical protein
MVWAKVSDDFNSDPVLLGLPRGVRLLHIEGTVWCCQQLTDGDIPRHMVARFTDEPDPLDGAALLVETGLWAATDTGWAIVGFVDQQRSKAEVMVDRAEALFRKARAKAHKAGDHSKCTRGTYCPNGAIQPPPPGVRANRRANGHPTEQATFGAPVLTSPDPEGKDGSGHPPPLAASESRPLKSKVTFVGMQP